MNMSNNPTSTVFRVLVILSLAVAGCSPSPRGSVEVGESGSLMQPVATSRMPVIADPVIRRIRKEGLNNSKVMETLDHLTNGIGPRLTASPAGLKASEWTRDQLASWGLSNAHLDAWGTFDKGWTVKRYSMQGVSPRSFPLISYPKAWCPGFDKPVEAEVVHLDATTRADLEKFSGKLEGKIVLIGEVRKPEAHFQPLATRRTDEDLEKMAVDERIIDANEAPKGDPQNRTVSAAERRAMFAQGNRQTEALVRRGGAASQPASRPTTRGTGAPAGRATLGSGELFNFAVEQKAAMVLTPTSKGDGGTLFVSQCALPGPTGGTTPRQRPWASDAPATVPQAMLGIEDFNLLARMTQRGVTPKLLVDLQVEFTPGQNMTFNTIAEIPGTDPHLKDEIVMVGAHLDSWHSATGTTDNGVGAACAMEAIRIIKALDLKPRRTIRVALWTGEEQGLHGSREYVKKHLGYRDVPASGSATAPSTTQPVTKLAGFDKHSVYFNLDNGTGKIRGVFAQGNAAATPLFRKWLVPFHDLGAKTVTLNNTGGTDHLSFDNIGLPGFQFIQDAIEYSPRTHHSNMDTFDRAQEEDLKQASTIMAAFIWNAAQMDRRFPRKE